MWQIISSLLLLASTAYGCGDLVPRAEVVCYYDGSLSSALLDPCKCTILVVKNNLLNNEQKIFSKIVNYKDLEDLKKKNPSLKIVASIGGDNIKAETFSLITSSGEGIRNFSQGVSEFLELNKLDGVEIDWRWPSQNGGAKDKSDLETLMKVLRLTLDGHVHKISKRSTSIFKIGQSIIERIAESFYTTTTATTTEEDGLTTDEDEQVTTTATLPLDYYDDFELTTTDQSLDDTTTESNMFDDYEDYFDSDDFDLFDLTTEHYEKIDAASIGSDYLALEDGFEYEVTIRPSIEDELHEKTNFEHEDDETSTDAPIEDADKSSVINEDEVRAFGKDHWISKDEQSRNILRRISDSKRTFRGKTKFKDYFNVKKFSTTTEKFAIPAHVIEAKSSGWKFASNNEKPALLAGPVQRPLDKRVGTGKVLMLTIADKPQYIVKGYNLKALTSMVDLFSLPTNNLTIPQRENETVTYHHSRLMGVSDIQNADSLIDLVVSLGVPLDQLVLGIPTTATEFKLKDATVNIPRSPAEGKPTYISFTEYCQKIMEGNWTLERDEDMTGPYSFSDKSWIAFDDPKSITVKSKYALLRGLAGIGVHSIDKDDWKDQCKQGVNPILTTVWNTFTQLARTPRRAVLQSLVYDLEATESSIAPSFAGSRQDFRTSPFRIVRIVDRTGAIKAIRSNSETEFECSRQGYYRDPNDCSQFYRCVKFDQYIDDYTVFEYSCPVGLVFDDRWEVCAWPSAAPPCDGSSEIFPIPRRKNVCSEEGYFADPENCRWFFACKDYYGNGTFTQYEFRCPFGLAYDEENRICNWPWLVSTCEDTGIDVSNFGGSTVPVPIESFTQNRGKSIKDNNRYKHKNDDKCTDCGSDNVEIGGDGIYHPEKGIIVSPSYFDKKPSSSAKKSSKTHNQGKQLFSHSESSNPQRPSVNNGYLPPSYNRPQIQNPSTGYRSPSTASMPLPFPVTTPGYNQEYNRPSPIPVNYFDSAPSHKNPSRTKTRPSSYDSGSLFISTPGTVQQKRPSTSYSSPGFEHNQQPSESSEEYNNNANNNFGSYNPPELSTDSKPSAPSSSYAYVEPSIPFSHGSKGKTYDEPTDSYRIPDPEINDEEKEDEEDHIRRGFALFSEPIYPDNSEEEEKTHMKQPNHYNGKRPDDSKNIYHNTKTNNRGKTMEDGGYKFDPPKTPYSHSSQLDNSYDNNHPEMKYSSSSEESSSGYMYEAPKSQSGYNYQEPQLSFNPATNNHAEVEKPSSGYSYQQPKNPFSYDNNPSQSSKTPPPVSQSIKNPFLSSSYQAPTTKEPSKIGNAYNAPTKNRHTTTKRPSSGYNYQAPETEEPSSSGYKYAPPTTKKPFPSYNNPASSEEEPSGYNYAAPAADKPSFNYDQPRKTTKRPSSAGYSYAAPTTKKPTTTGYNYPEPSDNNPFTYNTQRQTTEKPSSIGYSYNAPTTKRPPTTGYSYSAPTTKKPSTSGYHYAAPAENPFSYDTQRQTTKKPSSNGYSYSAPTTKKPSTTGYNYAAPSAEKPSFNYDQQVQTTKKPSRPSFSYAAPTTKKPSTKGYTYSAPTTKKPSSSGYNYPAPSGNNPFSYDQQDSTTKKPSTIGFGYSAPTTKKPSTNGYNYPAPTGNNPFNYDKQQQTTKRPSKTYSYSAPTTKKPSTSGYNYPAPSGNNPFTYDQQRPTTHRPTTAGYNYSAPTTKKSSTTGYNYEAPSGKKPSFNYDQNEQTTKKPTTTGYKYSAPTTKKTPTPGYNYPAPSGNNPFNYDQQKSTTKQPSKTSYSVPSKKKPSTSGYNYPAPSSNPFSYDQQNPTTKKPSVTGYSYSAPSTKKPSSSGYNYPAPSANNPFSYDQQQPTTKKPSTNGYSYSAPTTKKPSTSGYNYNAPSDNNPSSYNNQQTTNKPPTTGYSYSAPKTDRPSNNYAAPLKKPSTSSGYNYNPPTTKQPTSGYNYNPPSSSSFNYEKPKPKPSSYKTESHQTKRPMLDDQKYGSDDDSSEKSGYNHFGIGSSNVKPSSSSIAKSSSNQYSQPSSFFGQTNNDKVNSHFNGAKSNQNSDRNHYNNQKVGKSQSSGQSPFQSQKSSSKVSSKNSGKNTAYGTSSAVPSFLKGAKQLGEGVRVRKPVTGGPSIVAKLSGGRKLQRFGPGGFRDFDDTLGPEVCERAGLFRHPDTCDKFYECYWDRWIEKFTLHVFDCPVTIVYDSGITACNWPFNGPPCTDSRHP